jgi:regulator of cell morphogenesis and NO signaling
METREKEDPYVGHTIGDLVAEDFRKASVFKKYNIDFCCRGGITIEEACKTRNVEPQKIIDELLALDILPEEKNTDYNQWPLDELSKHIIDKHHKYVREAIPMLQEFGRKVCKVHGESHPELIQIYKYFQNVAEELLLHMGKEECMLFPYINALVTAAKNGGTISKSGFGTIRNPISMMEIEHIAAGSDMDNAKELSNNFTPPENACATYKVFFLKLKEFEEDLHLHIHLENNILFRRAILLEDQLLGYVE